MACEAPSHLGYRLLTGLPVRDYRADVTLATRPQGGTTIVWHSTFRPKWPGTGGLNRILLSRFIRQTAAELARAADSDRP